MRSALGRAALVGLIAYATPLAAQDAECGLGLAFLHETRHYDTRQIYANDDAVFFTAPMAVNTDGAPNSYHPDDPYGALGKAINTVCNGADAVLTDGRRINFSRCRDLIRAFRESRAAGWTSANAPRMDFYRIALDGDAPCINQSGAFRGYFVSRTSLEADPTKDGCDQDRYLNSLEIPYAVYPDAEEFTSRGVGLKDIAVFYNPETDVFEYGVVGNEAPAWELAGGSVAFAKSLKRVAVGPSSRDDSYGFGVWVIHALILPNESIEPPYTAENVRARAQERFEAWGGKERFYNCVDTVGQDP